MQEDKEFLKAKDTAFRLLGYRQRSKREISQRLKKKGFSPKTVKKTIEYLSELNYLNDEDFAQFWIRSKMQSQPVGWALLRYQLRQKGVAQELVERLSRGYAGQYNEYEVAKELAAARRNRYRGLAPAVLKRRLYDYLRRRGFPQEVILQAIEKGA